ncbi:MAG: GNAT family protein [Actinomycetota bacterium]
MNQLQWELGEGLVVRTYVLGDAEELFALIDASRDRLRRWMIWEPTTKTIDDTRGFIRACLASTDYEGNGLWRDGALIGGIGLGLDTMSNSGEIGYWLGGGHEGRGIVTRACARFFDFAFDELGLHRIELQAAVDNTKSRAVAERLGMHEEGVARDGCRVAGGYLDSVTYGILEDEWRSRRGTDAT